jgi:chaperonin GroES
MKAVLNQVILKPFLSDIVSLGGILVPESFKERSSKALVISAGNGTKKRPMLYKEGQTVYHVKGHGMEIEKEGEKYFIMDMDAILAYED